MQENSQLIHVLYILCNIEQKNLRWAIGHNQQGRRRPWNMKMVQIV